LNPFQDIIDWTKTFKIRIDIYAPKSIKNFDTQKVGHLRRVPTLAEQRVTLGYKAKRFQIPKPVRPVRMKF